MKTVFIPTRSRSCHGLVKISLISCGTKRHTRRQKRDVLDENHSRHPNNLQQRKCDDSVSDKFSKEDGSYYSDRCKNL